ncbi:MAG TPA: hypothetical protein VMO78_03875 [Rhizomicrobium sp.]|nr:hypothetical protein [Rhizomicrobium sp.]
MHYYEIRVVGDDGKTSLILTEFRNGDDAAIREAKTIARDHKFVIWRGLNCIYGVDTVPAANSLIPDQPAA